MRTEPDLLRASTTWTQHSPMPMRSLLSSRWDKGPSWGQSGLLCCPPVPLPGWPTNLSPRLLPAQPGPVHCPSPSLCARVGFCRGCGPAFASGAAASAPPQGLPASRVCRPLGARAPASCQCPEGQGRASFLSEPGTLILPVPGVGVAGGRMSLAKVTQEIRPQTAPGHP